MERTTPTPVLACDIHRDILLLASSDAELDETQWLQLEEALGCLDCQMIVALATGETEQLGTQPRIPDGPRASELPDRYRLEGYLTPSAEPTRIAAYSGEATSERPPAPVQADDSPSPLSATGRRARDPESGRLRMLVVFRTNQHIDRAVLRDGERVLAERRDWHPDERVLVEPSLLVEDPGLPPAEWTYKKRGELWWEIVVRD